MKRINKNVIIDYQHRLLRNGTRQKYTFLKLAGLGVGWGTEVCFTRTSDEYVILLSTNGEDGVKAWRNSREWSIKSESVAIDDDEDESSGTNWERVDADETI